MATVTAGNSATVTVSGDQTIDVSVGHNNSGRLVFVPSNDSQISGGGGTSVSFGPLPIAKEYGPFGVGGTLTIYCDVGTVTYTVNPSSFQSISVASSYTQVNGNVSMTGTGTRIITTTGTGTVTLGATGTGSTTITRVNSLTVVSADNSGTPGNATNNNLSGRAAFAAAASSVVITNSLVTAASKVFIQVNGNDATLKSATVTAAAGSFTVTGNAAATATTVFDFLVVN